MSDPKAGHGSRDEEAQLLTRRSSSAGTGTLDRCDLTLYCFTRQPALFLATAGSVTRRACPGHLTTSDSRYWCTPGLQKIATPAPRSSYWQRQSLVQVTFDLTLRLTAGATYLNNARIAHNKILWCAGLAALPLTAALLGWPLATAFLLAVAYATYYTLAVIIR